MGRGSLLLLCSWLMLLTLCRPFTARRSKGSSLRFPFWRTYGIQGGAIPYSYDVKERVESLEELYFVGDEEKSTNATEINVVVKSKYNDWVKSTDDLTKKWMKHLSIDKFPSSSCSKIIQVPERGTPSVTNYLFVDDSDNKVTFDKVWSNLKGNTTYVLRFFDNSELSAELSTKLATSWALSQYRFDVFKSTKKKPLSRIVWPSRAQRKDVLALVKSFAIMKVSLLPFPLSSISSLPSLLPSLVFITSCSFTFCCLI